MKEIIKEKTCAVSGHRNIGNGIEEKKVEDTFEMLINNGYDTFLIGMAVGFDFLCFHVLEKIRKEKNIKIIACIPCEGQSLKFSESQKREYSRMLESADEKIILSEKYTPYCMQNRNRFMVDNCSVLVCFLRVFSGGTFNTYNYAKSKKKDIICI